MQNKLPPILAAAGLALFLATAANAQSPIRVRGTIERVDGPTYVVKSRDGTELKVTLADNAQVTALTKASLNDIKQGSFVASPPSRRPTAANARSRCTSFPKPCVEPVKAIDRGISRRTAP